MTTGDADQSGAGSATGDPTAARGRGDERGPGDGRVAAAARQALAACALFCEVDGATVGALARRCRPVRLSRGEVLFHRGEPSRGFFVVVSGRIKLAVSAADGRERVIEVIEAGHPFAEATLFADRPYPVTATALEASTLLAVPTQPVLDLLEADPALARQMLAGLSTRLHTLVRDAAASLQPAAGRLVGYLLADVDVHRGRVRPASPTVSDGDHELAVDLRISKQVLAARLGLRPETLSRTLQTLSSEGLIRVEGRRVVIADVTALRDFVGEL